MKHVLRFQPLHQPVSNQLVVFRSAQVSRHILESREEAGKVFVVVELLDFGERGAFHPVPLPQFQQRGRLDRALEMQMQFGLGSERTKREAPNAYSDSKGSSRVVAGLCPASTGQSPVTTQNPIIR